MDVTINATVVPFISWHGKHAGVRGSIYATVPLHRCPFPAGRYIPVHLVPPAGTCLYEFTMCCIFKLYWQPCAYKGLEVTWTPYWEVYLSNWEVALCNFVTYQVTSLVESRSPLAQSAVLSPVPSREAVLMLKTWCARRAPGGWGFWGKNLKYGLASFLTITFH